MKPTHPPLLQQPHICDVTTAGQPQHRRHRELLSPSLNLLNPAFGCGSPPPPNLQLCTTKALIPL